MKKIILAAFVILSGCAGAELVSVNAFNSERLVKYKNGNFVREQSREQALSIMQKSCEPKSYKIVKESFNPDVFSVKVGDSHYSGKDNYMFITFVCE